MAEQQLPVWYNEGVEPPANLQRDGWQPGVKPPAQYFDWLFNRAYKCLEELQAITEELETNKANSTELTTLNNKVTQHLDETFSQLIATTRDATLAGQQIISGLTGKPKFLLVDAVVSGTKKTSFGRVGEGYQHRISQIADGSVLYGGGTAIVIAENSVDFTQGVISINNDNTITIVWSKGGIGATGTIAVRITAFYHGGDL